MSASRDLALAILSRLVDEGIASPLPSWNEETAAAAARKIWAGVDRALYAAQLRKLATSEPDEKLREAYWEEYREYKESIR